MRKENIFFPVGCFIVIFGSALLTNCKTSPTTSATSESWSITQKNNIVEIGYGRAINFHQYAALHLEDSYFRMNYGPGSGWGTSVVLLPSFWEGGSLYQGAPINATWEIAGEELVLSIDGTISNLSVQIQLRLLPPEQGSISAEVAVNVTGNVVLDERLGEAFKLVMLSSMHISSDKWDTQAASVNSQAFPLPESSWIVEIPTMGNKFGLTGGTSVWKTNAPTIDVMLNENRHITGWVTLSNNPNDDNVGFWAASDQFVRFWQYTITSSQAI